MFQILGLPAHILLIHGMIVFAPLAGSAASPTDPCIANVCANSIRCRRGLHNHGPADGRLFPAPVILRNQPADTAPSPGPLVAGHVTVSGWPGPRT